MRRKPGIKEYQFMNMLLMFNEAFERYVEPWRDRSMELSGEDIWSVGHYYATVDPHFINEQATQVSELFILRFLGTRYARVNFTIPEPWEPSGNGRIRGVGFSLIGINAA